MEIFYIGPNSVGAIRLLNSGSTSLYNTAGCVQVWYGGRRGNIYVMEMQTLDLLKQM